MESTRYLIVGGSAAGMAAAGKIRDLDKVGHIRVLSEEPDHPYFRPMIPYLISKKKTREEMSLSGKGPYRARQIEMLPNTRATRLEPTTKTVTVEDGRSFSYSKLLIATGSRPYIPRQIKGTQLKGVYALRTLTNAQEAAERATKTRNAVLLGGGLLNLKAAFALLERQVHVTLVVYSPEILSQLMEPGDAMLIRQALDQAGLHIVTGKSAVEIVGGPDGVCGVILDDGNMLECQMVCIGKGVQANVEWLGGTGIDIQQGVLVDKVTRTSIPDTYAAGDVAVTFDPISGAPVMTGLWTNAVEMGSCAGANMAGNPTNYRGTFGILNATQVADMPFVSMGIVHTRGTGLEVFSKQTANSYRKLVFSEDGRQLVGALFIGDIGKAGLYRAIIRDRKDVRNIKSKLISQNLHYGHMIFG